MDVESVGTALEILGDTSTTVTQVFRGVEAVKSLFGSKDNPNRQEVEKALAELSTSVALTQVKNAELHLKLSELERELIDSRKIRSDLERYALHETDEKGIVLKLLESAANGEPMHFICPQCAQDSRKSILQGSDYRKKCHRCGTWFLFKEPPPRPRHTQGLF